MTDPTQAVVQDSTVTNVVLMDEPTAVQFRELGFVALLWPGGTLVDVTDVDPQPSIGWSYDGTTFTPPPAAGQP